MKNLLLLSCLVIYSSCFASTRDSTFQRHMFNVSLANGVSELFFDGPTHHPTKDWMINPGFLFPNNEVIGNNIYTPMYAVHIQLHYSFGISPLVRIETGIGYLLDSYVNTEGLSGPGIGFEEFLKTYFYEGNITIPIYIKFTKPTPHGAFTCSIGPDFTLPVHSFYHNTDINLPSQYFLVQTNGHERFTTNQTTQASSMGGYLKMGYEKQLKNGLFINVGPAVDFFGLLEFHTDEIAAASSGYYPYRFYAALDVAVCFGLKKK